MRKIVSGGSPKKNNRNILSYISIEEERNIMRKETIKRIRANIRKKCSTIGCEKSPVYGISGPVMHGINLDRYYCAECSGPKRKNTLIPLYEETLANI